MDIVLRPTLLITPLLCQVPSTLVSSCFVQIEKFYSIQGTEYRGTVGVKDVRDCLRITFVDTKRHPP